MLNKLFHKANFNYFFSDFFISNIIDSNINQYENIIRIKLYFYKFGPFKFVQ